MSGHSKWNNIAKRKGANDAKKAKIFTKIGREMAIAIKEGGSANPDFNARLRDCIAKAKANNMPNDNIKRTLDKYSGANGQVDYEANNYEGYGVGGVAVVVETLTDNKNRTVADVRHLFDKYGAGLGASGCVSWQFDKKGVIIMESEGLDEDAVMMQALDAGAEDFLVEEGVFEIYTAPDDFSTVREALEKEGYTGLEVARKIRETDKNCAILFLTGFDKFDYARQAISVRAMEYLLKPYNEQELVFAVEEAIRQVSVQLPARPLQAPVPEEPVRPEEDGDMRTAIIRAEIGSFIDAHYREDISMQDAAAALRYSDAYFCKLFKQCFKVNFSAYLNEYRVNRARQLMLDPRLNMKDIGAAVGYSDANYFTRVFKRLTGQTPSEYRMAAAEKAVQG